MNNNESSIAVQGKKKQKREPLFHITKRPTLSIKYSLLIRISAILIALIFMALITLIVMKKNPIEAYAAMFAGVFGANTMTSLNDTAILLCVGLALTPAFKMRFWNTGAEGQVLVGALASAFCMKMLYFLPTGWLILVMFVTSILMGAVWAAIPAIFKAFFGTNETLFTLMMNSVASCLTLFTIKLLSEERTSLGCEDLDPKLKVNLILGNKAWIVITVVLIIVALLYIYLKYTKHGYEISVVGESEKTAKYVGINVKWVIIRTMVISGILCGIAGFLITAPSQSLADDIVAGRGFTAIMVAWLAKFNPILMILSAFLFVFVSTGGQALSKNLDLPAAYGDILIGILLFFIIGCEFFINYKVIPCSSIKSFFTKITASIKKTDKESKE